MPRLVYPGDADTRRSSAHPRWPQDLCAHRTERLPERWQRRLDRAELELLPDHREARLRVVGRVGPVERTGEQLHPPRVRHPARRAGREDLALQGEQRLARRAYGLAERTPRHGDRAPGEVVPELLPPGVL